MALLLRRSIFYHFPKTGGTFVRRCCHEMGIVVAEIGPGHAWPDLAPMPGLFSFTFARDLEAWYRSFWRFCMLKGWDWSPPCAPISECRSERFEVFRENVRSRCPEWLPNQLRLFGFRCDFVGRTETLADDLVRALTLAGEEFDEDYIRSRPPANVTGIDNG